MNEHEKINYVEYPSKDIPATKRFFETVFGWGFVDFGPDYAAFSNQGLDGGFFRSELSSTSENGAALTIFYSQSLEATEEKVKNSGGVIIKEIFTFPGGRRFHFIEPSGNEFAVWSEVGA
jgi:predicted enzyme related to lactoylglutathione lyase